MSDYLLDTNAIIALLEGDFSISNLLTEPHTAFVPIIVVGELYFGAEKSGRVEANLRRTEAFVSQRTVLGCDHMTAREYGRIAQKLRLKGRPIPQNDMWIAAIALQHNLTLLTRDAHFNDIDGLTIQGW